MSIEPSRPRVALYGHDTLGLGHLRRNLALAGRLADGDVGADVLLLTGAAAAAGRFVLPAGVDLVVLPEVEKDRAGDYAPARWRGGLDQIVALRGAVLRAALRGFDPDLLVVDKTPLGFRRELAGALPQLAQRGTRLVLGLRDVLDDPATSRVEWRAEHSSQTVRDLYDEVWVYGDPRIHDLAAACEMPPAVVARTHHVGYLSQGRAHDGGHPAGVTGRFVLGMVGGGADGADLARAFAAASPPPGVTKVLVAGPYLPTADRVAIASTALQRDDLVVIDFAADCAHWLAAAEGVVCMAGANTVAELLATDTPALLVPRTEPRLEQLVRAESLAAAGYADVLHPNRLTPAQIGQWLTAAPGRRVDRSSLALDGLSVVEVRAAALLAQPVIPAPETAAKTAAETDRVTASTVENRRADVRVAV